MNNEYRFPIQSIRTLVQRRPANPCIKQQDTQLYANGSQFQGLDWAYWAMQVSQCWGWRRQTRRVRGGICSSVWGRLGKHCVYAWAPAECDTPTHTLHTRQNQGPLEAQSIPEGSLDVLLMLSDANDLHSTTGASGEAVTRDHISAPATQLCTSYCSQATGIIQYTVINIADTFLPFVYFCVVYFTKGA